MPVSSVPEWLTITGAMAFTGKSRRTIRRWLADPALSIRVKGRGASRLIHSDDLDHVNETKDAYRNMPTFGS